MPVDRGIALTSRGEEDRHWTGSCRHRSHANISRGSVSDISGLVAGQYCWQDPVGKKHYKLRTHHLKGLVKYVEQGGIIETHDDIPDMVRDQLYAEEQQRLEKQQKPSSHHTAYPININVLPSQSPPAILDESAITQAQAAHSSSNAVHLDPINISGLLDVAVEKYSNWQQTRVGSGRFKDDIKKACGIALENCLDLKLIHEDQDPDSLSGKA
ncbi:hypothetical protein McanMca71_005271 [Microsporum canis]|uniref:Uncharacterized protein n=1 Tax=Arthroderma otae (strain ATCC MYA-4605 / CBS 113480) TaxID=554155 RepID=C5FBH6_ARTOC|nr:conserved hypothetical protein [Microsporum canis CBS 113480]EEQ27160.1 conserved hypothetical protein [Microsporum canis CBS 113480]